MEAYDSVIFLKNNLFAMYEKSWDHKDNVSLDIQSSAVITWSNNVRYYINDTRTGAEYQSDAGFIKDTSYLA